jgi:acetyl-CoA synthase
VSKIIASAAIRGAHKIVDRADEAVKKAIDKNGENQEVGFPNTGYYLPIIYGITAEKVEKLKDMVRVLDLCKRLLPPPVKAKNPLPYLAPALDAGMVTFFAEEILEALRYLNEPDFYVTTEDPPEDKLWVGAADDIILRKRGVEFVDGSAPGFAAILGAAPSPEVAKTIAQELLEKSLYVFMGAYDENGNTFSQQLRDAGMDIGWNTRLVPFGPDPSAAVFAVGFATRAALAFGGIEPGDYRKILIYNKDRVFAFALTMGLVTDEWYANGAGVVNYGFPVIADTPIPEVLPTGICTYEHVVANINHEEIVAKATEVRGLKVAVSEVPVPVAYGPAFEGERVRGEDIYTEMGGGKTLAVELTQMKDMNEVEDGKVEVIGKDLKDIEAGTRMTLGIYVEVAGRAMQTDFEPILERQIHHLLNYAQGMMHIGQRDIAWVRIAKSAVDKGLSLEDLGKIIHAKYHEDFGSILDKVQVTIYTDEDKVQELVEKARGMYKGRDERLADMTDEETDPFYSCTLCQSFAPNHLCMVTPERPGLCGAYNWLDCKASNEINPTGPNQPVPKGEVLDPVKGAWSGVNEFVKKASRGNVEYVEGYSMMSAPMTSCGCFEAISAVLYTCNGFMAVDRDYKGMTPVGMKFTTLAGAVGGGAVTPGFVGHSKFYITSKKFLSADGGLLRMVWMPKKLKEEIAERFNEIAKELGHPDLLDKIADETVGTTEEEVLNFITDRNHPVLGMDPLM